MLAHEQGEVRSHSTNEKPKAKLTALSCTCEPRGPATLPPLMYRDYDIFEVLPNGSKVSIARMPSLELALLRLERLARLTSNECLVVDAETRQVIAQRNVPSAKEQVTKRVFQIAYDEELGIQRAELLRSHGYQVISVVGNEKAKILLSAIQRYDFFIVGSAAPEETRSEMVGWLKEKYPNVKILALNSPQRQVARADYNVTQNSPEKWLPIVIQELANGAAA